MSNSTIESKAQSQVSEKQDLMSDMDSVDSAYYTEGSVGQHKVNMDLSYTLTCLQLYNKM